MAKDETAGGEQGKALLWDSSLVAAARDILFLTIIFLYLIGFFYHAGMVQGFGIEVEFVDQPTWQMLVWAWDAVQVPPWVIAYLAILSGVFALMSYAGYLRQTALEKNPGLRPVVYGLVFSAILGGVALTINVSSWEGKKIAMNLRNGGQGFTVASIHFTPKAEAQSVLEQSPKGTKLQWYLIAESADRYHVFRRSDCPSASPSAVYSILKADVIAYDRSPPQDPNSKSGSSVAQATAAVPAAPATPSAPTPPASLLYGCQ